MDSEKAISELIITMKHLQKAIESGTKSVSPETLKNLNDFEMQMKIM